MSIERRYALLQHNHTGVYQPLDTDLTQIAGLSPVSGSLIRRNGTAWVIYADSNYATSGHSHTLANLQTWGVTSVSGNRYGVVPYVETDGVMEVGRYMDWHTSDGDTSDYAFRMEATSSSMIFSGGGDFSGQVIINAASAHLKIDDTNGTSGDFFLIEDNSGQIPRRQSQKNYQPWERRAG